MISVYTFGISKSVFLVDACVGLLLCMCACVRACVPVVEYVKALIIPLLWRTSL